MKNRKRKAIAVAMGMMMVTSMAMQPGMMSHVEASTTGKRSMMLGQEGLANISNPKENTRQDWQGDYLYWGNEPWQILNKASTEFAGANPGLLILSGALGEKAFNDEVELTYNKKGAGTSISAIITDQEGKDILFYDRIQTVADTDLSNQTVKVNVPDDFDKNNYELKVFTEEYTDETSTDYASAIVDIKVEVTGVTVKTGPTKVNYVEGQTFDPSGLVLTQHYNDGTSKDIFYNDITKANFSFDKTGLAFGDNKVVIAYDGKKVEQGITVIAKAVINVIVKTEPTKVLHIEGQTFEPSGLVLTQHYNDGTSQDVTYNDATKANFSFDKTVVSLGDTKVTFTYDGKKVEQIITVSAKAVANVTVKTEPTKVNYVEGQNFDPSGLVLTQHYSDGTSQDITYNDTTKANFSFDKTVLAVKDNKVGITYDGKTVEQIITVNAKETPVTPAEPTAPRIRLHQLNQMLT